MKKLAAIFGILAVFSMSSPNCWAAVKDFDGGAADGNTFLAGANWNDAIGGDDDLVPGPADRALINAGFAVTYGTSATTTLGSLIVGADWPTTGDVGTAGTLNMSAGKLIVTGGGDNFQIGRACCAGDGAMNMSGAAELEIGGSDPIIGTRENGVLDIGGTATVHPTGGVENYWRLGNFGPSIDSGLEGNGLLNVHDSGTFNAHVIFIADNDATGELRVADSGSVFLTGNLAPRPSGFFPAGSALVRMIGSSATLQALNLESESLPGEIRTKYRFDADILGVSAIRLTDAINITNNDLEVNLGGFVLAPPVKLTLFDGDQSLATNRIFGTFANLIVDGVLNPANYSVVYDQATGDIQLVNVQVSIPGDFDSDGDVDDVDYLTLSTNLHTDVSALTPDQSYLLGDMTLDRKIDGHDFRGFRFAFDDANGVGAFVAMLVAVPEPNCLGLALLGLVGVAFRRRRSTKTNPAPPSSYVRRLGNVLPSCLVGSLLASGACSARAQSLLTNGNLDATSISSQVLATPTNWVVSAARANTGPFNDGASSEAFAGGSPTPDTGPTDMGLFFKPFTGNAMDGPVTVNLSQDIPGTAGSMYSLAGWAGAEANYLSAGSEFAIEFLDGANGVIGGSTLSLEAAGLFVTNGQLFNYKQFTVEAVAPAGTVSVRARASMIAAMGNPMGGGQAFVVDDFTLVIPQVSLLGDFDDDGDVDAIDYLTLSTNLHTDVSALTTDQTYLLGDMSLDKRIDGHDFRSFRFAFDDANGVGAFVAMLTAVPEPSAGGLAVLGGFGALLFRYRRARKTCYDPPCHTSRL